MSRLRPIRIQLVADNIGEYFAGLGRLKAKIEFLGGLDALVTQNTPNQFVVAGKVLEYQCAGCVAKLMNGDAQTCRILNPVDNLATERDLFLVLAFHTGKQAIRVSLAHQRRAKIMDVLVNDRCNFLIKRELERDIVLDVVPAERQPEIGIRPSGLDQVFSELNIRQVLQSDRSDGQNRHYHC